MHDLIRHSAPTALAAFVLSALAGAQRPPSWVQGPAVAVPSSSITQLGKLAWFQHGGQVHVFSAATRRWLSRPVTAPVTIRNTHDWLFIDEGTRLTALAASRGVFETINVSNSAQVINQPAGRNDGILLVLDGATLWSFTGFVGRWASRSIAAGATVAVQRNVAIVADGQDLLGMSGLYGDWVPRRASATITATGVGDTVGWASDGRDAFGFSAIRNAWASEPLPASALSAPAAERDVAVWSGPTGLLAFSGVRGAFDRVTTGVLATVELRDHLAHAASPDRILHWMFSVPQARWTFLPTSGPATALLGEAVALLPSPGLLHAYSATTASFAPPIPTASALAVNATVAAAVTAGGNALSVFSAITGAWHPAPAAASPTLPLLARNGALLSDAATTTSWAFSARSGRFVPRANAGSPALHVDAGSALLAVEDDAALAVFEPRREIWLDTPLTPADRPLTLRIWRTTLVATTPRDAIGFGAGNGEIERVPTPSTVTDLFASSEVGVARTTAGVLCYSPLADVHTPFQFPEFRRMHSRGATVGIDLVGAAGARFGLVLGLPDARATPLPGLGRLTLGTAWLVPIDLGTLDTTGGAHRALPVPDLPSLGGLEVGLQAVVVPTVGSAYLSRMCSFRIH